MVRTAMMRRREFIGLAGGAAAGLTLPAKAQQGDRVRRIGVLSEISGAEMQAMLAAFRQQLQQLGWRDGSFTIDFHYAIADADQFRTLAAALVASGPDIILAVGSRALRALKEQTRTIPVVFTLVADPVAQGLVQSLSRPDANLTGLTNYEFSFSGKWLEALKEIEPRVARVLLMVNPQNSGAMALAKFVERTGPSFGVEMMPGEVRSLADIEAALDAFGAGTDRAVIVLPDGLLVNNRTPVIERVNRARLPAVYPFRSFADAGGLLSWGLDFVDVHRQAAIYAHRLLGGAKPAELPIQAPNKFQLVINMKTAKALGLTMPPLLLAAADEVIE
jgi:putative tryptophan/tyrosine transport system substrate-binding protein